MKVSNTRYRQIRLSQKNNENLLKIGVGVKVRQNNNTDRSTIGKER